ncbi:MAG: replication initiator protein A [Ruminococcus sp.]|nr:replication initiator protein A [Ruminococcus sp.]
MKSIKIGDKITLKRFIKIPQELIDDNQLTNDARIIYSCLLDRAMLSLKNANNWSDENGYVYLKFKQKDLSQRLGLSLYSVSKALNQLENQRFIVRKRNYNNKSDTIYVLVDEGWLATKSPPEQESVVHNRRCQSSELYDRDHLRRDIRSNIDYESLIIEYPDSEELLNGIIAIMVDVICTNSSSFVINNTSIPSDEIKSIMRTFNYDQMLYVIDCIRGTRSEVRNKRNYIISILYNAFHTESLDVELETARRTLK